MLIQAVALWCVCMSCVVLGLCGCTVVLEAPFKATRPAYRVDEKCDMGMLRATKRQACTDELAPRTPVWGLS